MSLSNKEYYIDLEVEMHDGYGASDQLYLSFDNEGLLEYAVLYGMHFYTELEIEEDYNIDHEEALAIIEKYERVGENSE